MPANNDAEIKKDAPEAGSNKETVTLAPEKKPDSKKPQGSGKKQPAEKKPGPGKFLFLVIFVLLAGALTGGGWWAYGYFNQYLDRQLDLARQAGAEDIQRLQAQLENERQSRLRDISGLQQSAATLANRINSQGRRLRELSGTTRSDWQLAEAEYLIRMGIQRFITERNSTNAIALLEAADQLLSEVDEVDLLPVRRALARDITTLRLVNNIDREGLYLKLGALSEAVMTLPLIPLQPEMAEVEEVVAEQQEQSWSQQLAANTSQFLESLLGLVRVQRRSAGLEPLLSVEEEAYIRQNLRSMLEQAQLAMLREEQVVYRESLEKAVLWLQDYFALNPAARQLAGQLEELAQTRAQVDYPYIGGGLQSLKDFIDAWHARYLIEAQSVEASAGENSAAGEAEKEEAQP